jgi:hypothetical protein
VKFRLSCCALLAAGLLSACTYESKTGNARLTPEITTSIRKGITSKEQVRALLGDPQSTKSQLPISQPPGGAILPAEFSASEIWAYWSSTDTKPLIPLSIFSGKPGHSRYTVIIFFDPYGTVLDCKTEDMQI